MIQTASAPALTFNSRLIQLCERGIVLTIVAYALAAPHSIALTQSAALAGLLLWSVKLALVRDFRRLRSPIDLAVLGFFACCVISSFLSYDPLTSIKGLRSPAFFFAFYLVSQNLTSSRFARTLLLLLISSSLLTVAYSAGQIAVGRGLQIDAISQDSPLASEEVQVGDIILDADGQRIERLEDLSAAVDSNRGPLHLKIQRDETVKDILVSRRAIRKSTAVGIERLGVSTSKGRSIRVSGFYSHYETYAEVLQLIASIAAGLLIAQRRKISPRGIFLAGSLALLVTALIMTSTRAAMAGLALSVCVMALCSFNRRVMAAVLFGVLLLAPIAFYGITRVRGPILLDPREGSTIYRVELWREAFRLIRDHPLVGIGKGSEGTAELRDHYGLYAEGRLPPGHFHSTPIQIATWWGLPALILYCSMMTILLKEFLQLSRRLRQLRLWDEWGLALGGIGVIVAFNTSSLFHFNFGDGEVVMMFWLMTGLVFAIRGIVPAGGDLAHASRLEESTRQASDLGPRPPGEAAAESAARAAKARQPL